MRETLARIASFIFIFLVGIIVFSATMSRGNTTMTTEMAPATLPMVYVLYDGNETNAMHGLLAHGICALRRQRDQCHARSPV